MTTFNRFTRRTQDRLFKSSFVLLAFLLSPTAGAKSTECNGQKAAQNAKQHPQGKTLSTLRASLRVTTKNSISQGREFHFVRLSTEKRRSAIRIEVVPEGSRRSAEVYGFDGRLGWQVSGGKVGATVAGRAKDVLLPFQIPALLAEIGAGKRSVTCRGDKKSTQLEMLRSDGRKLRFHLDKKGSLFRVDLEIRGRQGAPQFQTLFVKWQMIQGAWVPVEVLQDEGKESMKRLNIEHLDVNPALHEQFVNAPYSLMNQTPTHL